MKQDFIDKLPPDAQKQFLKYAIKLSEKTKQTSPRFDFLRLLSNTSGLNSLKANITKKLLTNLISLQTVNQKTNY